MLYIRSMLENLVELITYLSVSRPYSQAQLDWNSSMFNGIDLKFAT